MAANVFGKPVTDGNRVERAQKAYKNQNADSKRDQAIAYVRKEKEKFGNGVSTLCIFYNATGETISHVVDHNWYGKLYDSYPARVQNGQWGAFLHTKPSVLPAGSVGAVVYRGKYNNTDSCDQLLGWDTPWNQATQNNHSYCEIAEAGYSFDWDAVYQNMEASGRQHNVTWNGMFTFTTIEAGTSPLFEAKLTLDDIAEAKVEAEEAAAAAVALEEAEAKAVEAAGKVNAAEGVVEAA